MNAREHYQWNLRRIRQLAPSIFSSLLRGPYFYPDCPVPTWRTCDGLVILASIELKPDGNEWLHVSFSRRNEMPPYDEMMMIRQWFFPTDAVVVQVFPPLSEHVNIHPNTLHLWMRLGEERLIPDLRIDNELAMLLPDGRVIEAGKGV